MVLVSCATESGDVASHPEQPADFEIARSEVQHEHPEQVSTEALKELTTGNTNFAFDLYQAIRDKDGNLIYSPYSISIALAMVYSGARNETEQQMAQTLHYTLPQDHLHPTFNHLGQSLNSLESESGEEEESPFKLRIVNAIWGQESYEFQPTYLDTIARHYGSGLRLVDFVDPKNREQARLTINQWVSDQTEDKINDLIPENILNELTRLILTNAIYFKAEWKDPFLNGTRDSEFYLLDGTTVTVPMMSRRARTYFTEGEGYQAIALPYKGNNVEMVLLIPEQGQFHKFEQSLNREQLEEILNRLSLEDVKLYMPKYSYESDIRLVEVLSAMGMPDAFDDKRADFTGISVNQTPRLYIGHVLHKAFVAVGEIGTEAAAATGVSAYLFEMPNLLIIDRPFIFIIREVETGAILFLGRVTDPSRIQ
jgi:serpin B